MTPAIMRAFRDEVTQIKLAANFGSSLAALGRGTKNTMQAGWAGPRWSQALSLLAPAISLPDAVAKEDPTGQGRSRAERLTGLAGQTAASIGLGGVLNRATSGIPNKWVAGGANVAGGMALEGAAMHVGESVATAPWRLKRFIDEHRQQAAQTAPAPAPVPESMGPST